MEGQNLKGGGLQATLLESKPDATGIDCDNKLTRRHGSSVTAVLVFSTLVAVCGFFCYGFAVGYSSPVESGIMEDLGLSIAAYSVFGSVMTVGGMIGAILSGRIADILGRRLVPVYVAEITPKDLRGVFTAFIQLMSTFGFSIVFFIGNDISWRTLALLGAIPCLLQIITLFFIPESPRWLVKVGREKEFEMALQSLRGEIADISQEAADIRVYFRFIIVEKGLEIVHKINKANSHLV
ncbi:sugar transporter ESL1-like [Mangifera indica]|uniref:sugar transporter ESL1-like n=1 Tax=Mangifera indica TaxID=29780 RepID=UPI001CFA7F8E|nr:sugar transporter ESL1-like [Mangifera indica]